MTDHFTPSFLRVGMSLSEKPSSVGKNPSEGLNESPRK